MGIELPGMHEKRRRIFAVVERIPRGQVATYGQIADLAGLGRQARQVGYALHNCPLKLPWHRVVNAQGRISLPAESTPALTQRRRLESEGLTFLNGRLDLKRYRWQPDDDELPRWPPDEPD